ILLVLVHAVDAGLLPATEAERAAWEEEFAGAVEYLSAVGYTGMLGRMRAGLAPVISDDGDVARETADAEDSRETDIAGEVEDAANSEVAAAERDLDSAHLEALLLAGDSRPALSVAMRAALSADRAPEMVEIATLMAELGHTSDALDVARRAVSRAELALTPEIITLIYPVPFRAELQDAADRYEVPVYLLTALVREESHFRPRARSPVGAQGLGQIMPATGDDIRRRMNWPAADVSRPADNLLMSAYYLNYLAEQIESSVIRLAAYNAGLGRGRRWEVAFGDLPPILQIEALPFGETRGYLRRITVSQAIYRERMVGTELDTALSEFKEGRIW
ncbi:MAG: lytic transglycosylase domain-containing protein, partial [Alkalispirochaeta sp.]